MKISTVAEVEDLLLALSPARLGHIHEKYIGGGSSSYRFLNLSVPQVRAATRHKFSFTGTTHEWAAWDEVWKNSQIYDVLSAAVIWASSQSSENQWRFRKMLLSWSMKANNWALSDGVSSIYAKFFEQHPDEILTVLEKWAHSKNPWQRRMSVVSLFYYSSARKKYPPFSVVKRMIARQLGDDHYYVQKGLGWALRESFNVYPRPTIQFLEGVAQKLPPAAWTAATEKLTPTQKKKLAALRKKKP